jgi:hypothetical protein
MLVASASLAREHVVGEFAGWPESHAVYARISQAGTRTSFKMKKEPECWCGNEGVEVLASQTKVEEVKVDVGDLFVFTAVVNLEIGSDVEVQLDRKAQQRWDGVCAERGHFRTDWCGKLREEILGWP